LASSSRARFRTSARVAVVCDTIDSIRFHIPLGV